MRTFTSADEIRQAKGEELGTSDWLVIEQDRVDRFAEATGDFQWIHVDAERAAAGPYGGTIAHGYLTLALIPSLLKQVYRVTGARMGLNYGLDKVRFITPVPVGKRVRASSCMVDVTDVADGAVQVTFETTVEVEGSQKPACVARHISRLLF